jgi:hypothetical protein
MFLIVLNQRIVTIIYASLIFFYTVTTHQKVAEISISTETDHEEKANTLTALETTIFDRY